MKLAADLHIHSHYSRATSRDLDLEHLYLWGQHKGVHLIGTGDFTHPGWAAELRDKLEPAEAGLYRLRADLRGPLDAQIPPACRADVRFLLSVEISNIYKQDGAVRKVHNLVLAPDLDAAARISARLGRIGNISSDGRPILGLSSRDLLAIVLEEGRGGDPDGAYLVPAHIWTPHFSVFGSMSGFDSLTACYGDLTSHIFALETGLSSDPAMNWRLSALDPYTLVSNSDAHSPAKLGREANLLDIDPSFLALRQALETADPRRFLGTVEFYPEEGKYHLDGHRDCQVRQTPEERAAAGGLCPRCGKPVTVGVLSRVDALADRPEGQGYRPPRARPYFSLVPLPEIIGECLEVGPASEAVRKVFHRLLANLGNELYILQEAPLADIAAQSSSLVAEAVRRVRGGELDIHGGFDGEYGTVRLFHEGEQKKLATPPGAARQMSLFGA